MFLRESQKPSIHLYNQWKNKGFVRPCGNEHGLVKGIGVVNLVHSSGKNGDFYPMDYRIYSPETDGKSKNNLGGTPYFQEMFIRANADKNIQARTILFDSW